MNKLNFLIINFIIFIIFLFILFSLLTLLNLFLGGNPVYSKMGLEIETLVKFYKNNNDTYKINFNKKYVLIKCGHIENGKTNLAYNQDKYGFRENLDQNYKNVDIVILGDSFGFSQCINKPNDFNALLAS